MKALLLAFAMAAAVVVPASAQSFDADFGTGNERPFAYQPANRNAAQSWRAARAEALHSSSRTGSARMILGVTPMGDDKCFIPPGSQSYTGCF